jgi:hypothetical protein
MTSGSVTPATLSGDMSFVLIHCESDFLFKYVYGMVMLQM